MDLNRELWIYLCLIAVGAVIYTTFGELSGYLTELRFVYAWQDPNNLGLDLWIYVRIMMMGLFIGALGIIGTIVKLRSAKLIL